MKDATWYIRNLDEGLITDDGVTPTEFSSKKDAMNWIGAKSSKKIIRGLYEVKKEYDWDGIIRTFFIGTKAGLEMYRWE
jgi:hypothetical protein